MLLSHISELAIRATVHLALQPPGKVTAVHQIAHSTGLRKPLLSKIIARLTRARLLRAFRGPGGGVELGRPPDQISLWSVVRAIDGPVRREPCAMGLRACAEGRPCPLHPRWTALRAQMQCLLKETTIASVAQNVQGLGDWRTGSDRKVHGGENAVLDRS